MSRFLVIYEGRINIYIYIYRFDDNCQRNNTLKIMKNKFFFGLAIFIDCQISRHLVTLNFFSVSQHVRTTQQTKIGQCRKQVGLANNTPYIYINLGLQGVFSVMSYPPTCWASLNFTIVPTTMMIGWKLQVFILW